MRDIWDTTSGDRDDEYTPEYMPNVILGARSWEGHGRDIQIQFHTYTSRLRTPWPHHLARIGFPNVWIGHRQVGR